MYAQAAGETGPKGLLDLTLSCLDLARAFRNQHNITVQPAGLLKDFMVVLHLTMDER